MIHDLRILGMAIGVILGLSAVVVTDASAQQGVLTSDGPVTLTGTETAGAFNGLKAFGLTIKCPGSTGTGHKYNVTPHQLVPNGSTTFTLTPHFKSCLVSPGSFPATIDLNGCDGVTHIGETTGGVAGTYGGTSDLVCPIGNEAKMTVFTNQAKEAENKPFCILSAGSQAGFFGGGHATDTGTGTIVVKGSITGIKIKKTNGGEDLLLCPNAETSSGEASGDGTITGKNALGEATSISLSHN